ncbi:hypothetical protein Tco_0957254 [Tanacetum coccineum]
MKESQPIPAIAVSLATSLVVAPYLLIRNDYHKKVAPISKGAYALHDLRGKSSSCAARLAKSLIWLESSPEEKKATRIYFYASIGYQLLGSAASTRSNATAGLGAICIKDEAKNIPHLHGQKLSRQAKASKPGTCKWEPAGKENRGQLDDARYASEGLVQSERFPMLSLLRKIRGAASVLAEAIQDILERRIDKCDEEMEIPEKSTNKSNMAMNVSVLSGPYLLMTDLHSQLMTLNDLRTLGGQACLRLGCFAVAWGIMVRRDRRAPHTAMPTAAFESIFG